MRIPNGYLFLKFDDQSIWKASLSDLIFHRIDRTGEDLTKDLIQEMVVNDTAVEGVNKNMTWKDFHKLAAFHSSPNYDTEFGSAQKKVVV